MTARVVFTIPTKVNNSKNISNIWKDKKKIKKRKRKRENGNHNKKKAEDYEQ